MRSSNRIGVMAAASALMMLTSSAFGATPAPAGAVLGFMPPVELRAKHPEVAAGGTYRATVRMTGVDSSNKPWTYMGNVISFSQGKAGAATLQVDKAPPAGSPNNVVLNFSPTKAGSSPHTLNMNGITGATAGSPNLNFGYSKIEWTWVAGGKPAQDSWVAGP